jgi:type IV secretory pathway VirB2 component (pilin)
MRMSPQYLLASTPSPTGASGGGSVNLQWDPTQGTLPGETVLSNLASGVGHWALLASLIGIVVGGVMWAFGHFSHNYQQSYNGRKGVIVSGVAALLIGASQTIVTFFFNQGLNFK